MEIPWDKVKKPDQAFSRFPSRRSVVYGTKGVVSSTQPLATAAGLEILQKGGNAADAGVAVAAALNVTEPSCTGVGGDAFVLYYDAKTKQVKGLNASGRAPEKMTIEHLRKQGIKGNAIPLTDLNSVTVPGAAAGWVDATKAFGSGKLTLKEILTPAIRLAEEGVPVSELHSNSWQRSEKLIKNASPDAHAMLLNGRAPFPGEIMKMPDLAQTFRAVGDHGKDGFYKGRIAEAIVKLIKDKGGVMEVEDLAKHESTFVEPISYTFADQVTIYECPPNGQGLTALIALGLLDALMESGKIKSLLEMEHNSVEYLHTLVEVLRYAFADSKYFISDPDFVHVPVKELLSKEYLKKRAALFDPSKSNKVVHGNPENSSDTVYFSVTDQWGNGCSYIQSNYAGFGTGAIPHGCGFTLQNRGSNFVLDPKHPNCIQPGKRPYHTIIPAMALKGDELFMVYGVMGGFMQPQGHVQVLLNVLRGFTVQAALDAPRFCISAGLPDSGENSPSGTVIGDVNSEVNFEEGIPDEVIKELRAMGHDARSVTAYSRGMLGRGQIIQKTTDATSGRLVWAAGSDQRGDGHAAAQI